MNLKDSLKKYFDEEIKKDSALAEKYDVQKIAECESYVMGEAKKYLHSQNGAIEDVIVFKWARDFFIDGIKTEETKETKEKSVIPESKESEKKEENQVSKVSKVSKKKKTDESEYENFFDFGE